MEKIKLPILHYMNIFRGLAILIIILGHTIALGEGGTKLSYILCEIFTNGTVLFVFISGFLFEYLSVNYNYKTYMNKKFINVIMPYLFMSIPGILFCFLSPTIYQHGIPSHFDFPKYQQLFVYIISGYIHNTPTWYIPMTFVFFVIAPILLYLKKINKLFFILPFLLVVSFFLQKPYFFNPKDIDTIFSDLSFLQMCLHSIKFTMLCCVHYISIYVLGMYFAHNMEKIKLLYKYRNILLVLTILVSVLDFICHIKFNIYNYSVSKVFLTLYLLGILNHYDCYFATGGGNFNKVINIFAQYSFALFFVHYYYHQFFAIYLKPNLLTIPINNYYLLYVLMSILRISFVLLASFVTVYIIKIVLKKFGVKNTRMFIGV